MSIRSRRWEKHSVKSSPRVRWALSVLLLTASIAVSQQPPASPAASQPASSAGPEANSQAPQATAQGAVDRARVSA